MRSAPSTSVLESTGYSECLDRLAASGGVGRPLATYRLQFNAHFGFADAARLLPYLESLGITHVYASPLLKARAGSMHGYDITDHNLLNPEIGSDADLRRLTSALKSRGMGMLLDLVPNHVGVGNHNPWWQDVLENGRTSEFAGYFDIDWTPLKTELTNKLLLPVLGGSYGEELENGKLLLRYDEQDGRLEVHYYDKKFPVDPQTYPMIFNSRRASIEEQSPSSAAQEDDWRELRLLIAELGALPLHAISDPEFAAQRRRQAPELRKRLRAMVRGTPAVRDYILSCVEQCNGVAGDGRSFDCLHRLLEAQVYRLAHWRVSAEEINYRRFFDVNDLVGLRMENPQVFAATHGLVRRMLAEGSVTGIRVDHPDGLINPQQYFTRLQMLYCAAHCAGARPHPPLAENGIEADFQEIFGRYEWMARRPPLYVVVEKILQPGEPLPEDWPVDGTVGYEFASLVNGLFIDPQSERALTTLYRRFSGESATPEQIVYENKRLIMKTALPSEVNVLTHMLAEICSADRRARDFTQNALRDAVREIIACFPVYRTYIDERGNVSERDQRIIQEAVSRAKRRNQSTPVAVFDFIREILLLHGQPGASADSRRQRLAFLLKFQQLTGPVMAKGLEDTTFYVYNRFIANNEVGGSPRRFAVSTEEFHDANRERLEKWPRSMLATSTHDTKRSEDVRARLDVISETPTAWSSQVNRWRRATRLAKGTLADGRVVPDANEEYLLYQTLVGAAPFALAQDATESEIANFKERIQQYMHKAVHEAKVNLSWINSDPEYLEAQHRFIEQIFTPSTGRSRNYFWNQFTAFLPAVSFFGALNSLSQTLLKITAPGVPDIYQGNELWDFSLVDPDNRRPVDFERRKKILGDLQRSANSGNFGKLCASLLENYQDGAIKLWTTLRALNFRREHSDLFQAGNYVSLEATGSKRAHVCAFARIDSRNDEAALVVVPRLSYTLMKGEMRAPLGNVWENTELQLPRGAPGHFVNIFTGAVCQASAKQTLLCSEIFAGFPVALLAAS